MNMNPNFRHKAMLHVHQTAGRRGHDSRAGMQQMAKCEKCMWSEVPTCKKACEVRELWKPGVR